MRDLVLIEGMARGMYGRGHSLADIIERTEYPHIVINGGYLDVLDLGGEV